MACSTDELLADNPCLMELSEDALLTVAFGTLKHWAASDVEPGTLLKDFPCYMDLSESELLNLIFSNLCRVNHGGGGGGGGGGTGDPDVDAFVTCTGITSATTILAVLNLVITLKANSLWTSFDAIYPFVGGTASAHSCNLRDVTKYSISWHGGLTHDSNGVTGNGSDGYGETGFSPSASGGSFTLNSASLGVYCKTIRPINNTYFLGTASASSSHIGCGVDIIGNPKILSSLNSGSGFTSDDSDFTGNTSVSRTGATATSVYFNGGSTSDATASSALPAPQITILALNTSGVVSGFSDANIAFEFFGGGWSGAQVAIINTAITTFETALGRA